MNHTIEEKRKAVALLAKQASMEALRSLLNLSLPKEAQERINQILVQLKQAETITDIAQVSAKAADRARLTLEMYVSPYNFAGPPAYAICATNAAYAAYYAVQTAEYKRGQRDSSRAITWAKKAFNPGAKDNSKKRMKSFVAPYALKAENAAKASEELAQLMKNPPKKSLVVSSTEMEPSSNVPPPKLISRIMHKMIPPEAQDWLGDLDEVYYIIQKKQGIRKATKFYWYQAVRSFFYVFKIRFNERINQFKRRLNAHQG